MKRNKPYNNLLGAGVAITGTSVALGIGSKVTQDLGGNPSGLNTLSGYLPPVAHAAGGMVLVDMLNDLNRKTRRKR